MAERAVDLDVGKRKREHNDDDNDQDHADQQPKRTGATHKRLLPLVI